MFHTFRYELQNAECQVNVKPEPMLAILSILRSNVTRLLANLISNAVNICERNLALHRWSDEETSCI